MSSHRYTVKFFSTMDELISTFEIYAPYVEFDLYGSEGEVYINGEPETYTVRGQWGDSPVGAAAVAHAEATKDDVARLWYSRTDPREEADANVAALVRTIWLRVAAEHHPNPSISSYTVPGTLEERPVDIPRVRGVMYYPASSLMGTIVVPLGYEAAVAVREELIEDDDWEHICAVADPAHLEADLEAGSGQDRRAAEPRAR